MKNSFFILLMCLGVFSFTNDGSDIAKSAIVKSLFSISVANASEASSCDKPEDVKAKPFHAILGDDDNKQFVICNAKQLKRIGDSEESLSENYLLGANIDLANIIKEEGYFTIGHGPLKSHSARPFTGSFDGKSHTISNFINLNPKKYFIGLFGAIKKADIKNLKLSNFTLDGKAYVGSLAGKAEESSIENIKVISANVEGHKNSGLLIGSHTFEGSLEKDEVLEKLTIGDNNVFKIKNVFVSGELKSTGSHAGGITGLNHFLIEDVTILVNFHEYEAAQAFVVGYNWGPVTNAKFFPLNKESIESEKELAIEATFLNYILGKTHIYDACGNNYYDLSNLCRNSSNQLLPRSMVEKLILENGIKVLD